MERATPSNFDEIPLIQLIIVIYPCVIDIFFLEI